MHTSLRIWIQSSKAEVWRQALTRQERRQFLNDHLLANGAEGPTEIAHATVELRTVDAAVIIVRAFEEADRSHGNW